MSKPEIPPEVRRFILTSIPSIPHLEALLLLRGIVPASWSVSDMARRLYVQERVARDVLSYLHAAGIVEADTNMEKYFFRSDRSELSELVDALAQHYSTNLLGITALIHSRLERKAQQFANAFSFKKDT